METLDQLITLLRVGIIPLGVVFRVVFCFTKMIYDEEAQASYKKKIRNTIVFGIIAELILVILEQIKNYYGYYGPINLHPGSTGGGGSSGGAGATRDF